MRLELPYGKNALENMRAGDEVIISGRMYVGRDQVHKRLVTCLDNPPFPFEGNAVYYMGPSPAPDGYVTGAAGPTTSARMDPYSPLLLEAGLRVMIGKGPRSAAVQEACIRFHGVYLYTYGGCGALYASCIKSSRIITYPELGPEALLELEVEDFPSICLYDAHGGRLI